ncbi:MAG: amidophosphoribosyltransferase, partial [Bacteroidales bacterium]|nr:amidophosphoribosyltransferase [Bacteroidales bacterium]
EPKRIVVVSSSPQIRYPDCYGIDMAKLGDFIAFRAAIELLKMTGKSDLITRVFERAQEELQKPDSEMVNVVKEIYAGFTDEEISRQIAEMLKTPETGAEIDVVYQSVEGLHEACPGHTGDWYFTGNYPTPGGNRVVNRAFVNYIEGKNDRAY